VDRPRPDKNAIEPYTEDDIKAMLNSLGYSKPYKRFGKRETSANALGTSVRNKAIILLLLDTGIRATELCTLRISHFDLKNRRLHIHGKGSKERIVPCGSRTTQAVWKYLASRAETTLGDYLFVQIDNEPFDRNSLRKAIIRIGERAGVRGVGVHRFRHTFAINFLRNGLERGEANPWALQTILGHEDIKTVRIYLALAQADTDAAHKASSPVENWRL
jgi:integrase